MSTFVTFCVLIQQQKLFPLTQYQNQIHWTRRKDTTEPSYKCTYKGSK